ncbi:sortase [Thermomicrobium sp.]|uniref:sortase n=1 Tax=Thermomicrobium sp. TaxID=1969469 RepID=UPI0025801734|nr:sortase [Thermomicrobium sp.]
MIDRRPPLRRLSAPGQPGPRRAFRIPILLGRAAGASSEPVGRGHVSLLGTLLILTGLVLLAIAAMGTVALRPTPETPPSQIAAIATPPPPLQAAASPTPTATPFAERLDKLPIVPSPTPEPTPTPRPKMPPPTRIQIPSVGIDAPVVEVGYKIVEIQGIKVIEWEVAEYAAGHHNTSANPGEGGNIVITGHSDWKGEVFRTLEHVKLGDEVILTSDAGVFRYRVTEIHYRKEVGVPLEERIATGRFLDPMPEERVTLVTCWPYGIDDHRIIVVAKPVG